MSYQGKNPYVLHGFASITWRVQFHFGWNFPLILARFQNFHDFFCRSIPILTDLLELKKETNEHGVIPSDKGSFGVDNILFPNAMRIMAENKAKLSDFNWGLAT